MSMKATACMLLLLVSSGVSASQVTCIASDLGMFSTIRWDTDTSNAIAVDLDKQSHPGRVTHVRKHDQGLKITIEIDFRHRVFGEKPSEFVFFTTPEGVRVIGVYYARNDGKLHLDGYWGNSSVICEAD